MTGIYIHVPFCAKKCPYCDFYSCGYTRKSAERYKNAVLRNVLSTPDIRVDTVYFGGGTPSLIPAEYISEILEALDRRISLVSPEITIEVNPCTVTPQKLAAYKKAGINRLSVGVQSGNNDELEFLGRSHSFEKAAEVVETAAELGFENISCDLMIGIMGQTAGKLEQSVEKITALPVSHISSYMLKIEENTPFGRNNTAELLPDEDEAAELYLHSVKLLENAGFKQYEISNFAKEGFQSRHNLKYWRCEEYLGMGPSSHSYFGGRRFYTPDNLEEFCESTVQRRIYEDGEAGTDEEKIMLGLRLAEGICPSDYPVFESRILKKAANYCAHGLAELKNGRLCLTPEGFLVSNSIIADIIL